MRRAALVSVLLIPGCQSPPDVDEPLALPAIIAEGERVRIATDVVEQICPATLTRLDAELDRVEQELGLEPIDASVDVYLLDEERLAQRCGQGVYSCSSSGDIYVRAELFETRIVHELVHDRIAHTPAAGSPPIFDEGLAAAHALPWCPPLPSWVAPDPEVLLAATEARELPKYGEYLGGELVRWLLDTRGPDPVLAFMTEVANLRDPQGIRSAFSNQFGSEFDDEIFAHLRPIDEPLSREQSGCQAPPPPASTAFLGVELQATLDCGADGVHNDLSNPGRLYMEWTLEVGSTETGYFHLDGEFPEGTELRVEPCACRQGDGTTWLPESEWVADDAWGEIQLGPGIYRMRWSGPPGAVLDMDFVETCDFVTQDCPVGFGCNPSGWCVETPTDPQQQGEPCDMGQDFMGDCDIGLYCLGDYPLDGSVDGVCMSYCGDGSLGVVCPDGTNCGPFEFCAVECDPLAQDCEPGWECEPDFETGAGACIPDGTLGLLESCDNLFFDYCGPGLTCAGLVGIDGCWEDTWLSSVGCCTEICDPSAPVSTCPPELPNCVASEDDALGRCGP